MRYKLLSLATALFLVAILAYITVSAITLYNSSQAKTFEVYSHFVSVEMPINGIFLRSEHPLTADESFLSEHLEGRKLPVGFQISEELTAPVSGIFTSFVDGYEHVSSPSKLTPLAISAVYDLKKPTNFDGKIITETGDFFATANAESVAGLEIGTEYELKNDFIGTVYLTLSDIGESADNKTALRFQPSKEVLDTIYLRELDGELLVNSFSGIYLPKTAVCEKNNTHYVTKILLGKKEQLKVDIVYEGENFYLISSNELFEGNEVLEIYTEELT